MKVVVDASVAIKWFVQEAGHDQALALLAPGIERHVPDLVIAEAANILWKKSILGEISADQAEVAILALPACFAEIHRSAPLAPCALDIALRLNHPVYDCLYIACAERAGGLLVTTDRRLATVLRETDLARHVRSLDDWIPSEEVEPPDDGP